MIISKFTPDQNSIKQELELLNNLLNEQRKLKKTLLLCLEKISEGIFNATDPQDANSLISCLNSIKKSFENLKGNINQIIELKHSLEDALHSNYLENFSLEEYNKKYLDLFEKISDDNVFYYSFIESLLKFMCVVFPENVPDIPSDGYDYNEKIEEIAEKNILGSSERALVETLPVNNNEETSLSETSDNIDFSTSNEISKNSNSIDYFEDSIVDIYEDIPSYENSGSESYNDNFSKTPSLDNDIINEDLESSLLEDIVEEQLLIDYNLLDNNIISENSLADNNSIDSEKTLLDEVSVKNTDIEKLSEEDVSFNNNIQPDKLYFEDTNIEELPGETISSENDDSSIDNTVIIDSEETISNEELENSLLEEILEEQLLIDYNLLDNNIISENSLADNNSIDSEKTLLDEVSVKNTDIEKLSEEDISFNNNIQPDKLYFEDTNIEELPEETISSENDDSSIDNTVIIDSEETISNEELENSLLEEILEEQLLNSSTLDDENISDENSSFNINVVIDNSEETISNENDNETIFYDDNIISNNLSFSLSDELATALIKEEVIIDNDLEAPAFTEIEKENLDEIIEQTIEPAFIEKILIISKKDNTAILPYSILELEECFSNNPEKYSSIQDIIDKEYTISTTNYKNTSFTRFKTAFNLAKNKSNLSFIESLNLANELFFNSKADPLIIVSCKNIDELDIYLSCLADNVLEDFNCFQIKYI